MILNYLYMFECDYGARTHERQFIKDILNKFDKDYATMVGIVVNNNPYCFSFHVAVNLQKDPVFFEEWLRTHYPGKLKRHNIFTKDIYIYNVITLIDADMVDFHLTEEGSFPFIYPERKYFEENNPQYRDIMKKDSKVFISHSSKDKIKIVNPLNAYLQGNDIATWLDSYEIDYGDNIFLKVNEGIQKSDVGLFILTDNFFDSQSGWPLAEFSTFFMSLMKSNKKVLMVDAGVSPENMLEMMRAYKYINWNNGAGLPEIANAIKKIMTK
ncbi:toll/interleukin-1 receptor domain-containing protein [Cronobacter sakazakii]|uniref:toll/interleukin-1 receptor domain-containing protein n=1 Tax=Cronobacter sakazakii TaxID=28141 RepID=UPI000CFCD520|nr:toll/interleukin-1 receptor domain-containing protein [Cronobacter sakazakii]ELY3761722.1 toll/interleukin-1 receptor domain-containing protein [Cronobacter universalis]ELY3804311.1 toll/interleukin-1 receptor domain-containing protein [Cronobacter sakazakii]MDK1165887.1 toll/interleukin-1 receptor domain-containing protein [Cronobacter sakazakii]